MPPVKAPIFFPFLTPAAGLHWDCPPPHPRPHPCPLQAILLSAAEAGFNAEVRSCNSPVFNAPVTSHNSQEEGHILHVGDPALPELGKQQATDPLTTSSIPTSQISSCNHGNSACPVAQLTLLSEPRSSLPKLPGGQGPLLPCPSPASLPPPLWHNARQEFCACCTLCPPSIRHIAMPPSLCLLPGMKSSSSLKGPVQTISLPGNLS